MTKEELIKNASYKLKLPIKQIGYEMINDKLVPWYEYYNIEYYFNDKDEEIGYCDNAFNKIITDTKGRLWDKEIKDKFHKEFI